MRKTRTARLLAVGIAAVSVIAASCGSDNSSSSGGGGSASSGGSAAPLSTGGFSTSTGAAQPKQGGKLTVAHVSNPSSLDPVLGGSGNDHMSLYPFYDRLINFDPEKLTPTPGLATQWSFPDPMTLVLDLRSGVTFHDGTPFDATAVQYNLNRGLTLAKSTEKADLSMIDNVEVASPTQVKIHLKRQDTSLVLILADRAGMMVSPTAAKAANDDLSANPVGTGPYKFVEWQRNDHLTMTKNTNYWQPGKPYLDQITIRFIPDQQTEINALQAGEVDFGMKIDPGNVDTLKKNDALNVSVTPSLGLEDCYFNFSKAPFNNPDVRKAFNLALDRDALNQAYTFGLATPAQEVYPPGYWAADPKLANAYPHDVAQAKELLAKAGFPNGVDIKAVAYDASGQTRKNEIIQSQIADAGFKMTFDTMEVGAATSTFFEKLTYDVYCAGWSGRPDPSQTALSLFSPNGYYNAGKYTSPGMVDALNAAGTSTDQAARAQAFSKVIQLSQQDSLFVPLLHQADIDAFSKKVGGFQPNLYGKVDVSFLWLNS